MGDWFTVETFVAFVLGVLLAAFVKNFVSSVKSKVGA
jgi:hypothetical protein